MNALALEWMTTTVTLGEKVDVETLEFVVDEQRLVDWVRWTAGAEFVGYCSGRVSPFGRCFPPEHVKQTYRQLLAEETSDLPHGRVPLYVCPCGDPFCGGLMVSVSRIRDGFEWSNWGSIDTDFPDMPTLRFARQQYETALSVARVFF